MYAKISESVQTFKKHVLINPDPAKTDHAPPSQTV